MSRIISIINSFSTLLYIKITVSCVLYLRTDFFYFKTEIIREVMNVCVASCKSICLSHHNNTLIKPVSEYNHL